MAESINASPGKSAAPRHVPFCSCNYPHYVTALRVVRSAFSFKKTLVKIFSFRQVLRASTSKRRFDTEGNSVPWNSGSEQMRLIRIFLAALLLFGAPLLGFSA
jgi:hypothetical protein